MARRKAKNPAHLVRKTKSGATALIEKAQQRKPAEQAFPAASIPEIKKILAYNDSVPTRERVSQDEVIDMLANDFGFKVGSEKFRRLIRQTFKRKTFGQK